MPKKASTLYELLEVSPRATPTEIEVAYQQLSYRLRAEKDAHAGLLWQAHHILLDDKTRHQYDLDLKAGTVELPKEVVIGDYRILGKIGDGGFGKTYKAEDLETPGGFVCIKYCSKRSDEGNRLMAEEIRTMWDLHYEGLPAVRGKVRMPNGNIALVMSYIPGPTLFQAMEDNGPLTPESVTRITERILLILAYLHTRAPVPATNGRTFRGIIHGDLNPKNIILQLLPNTYTLFLVDFGLARVNNELRETSRGSRDFFSPPEQLPAANKELVPASDLFALGTTMIYALTRDMKAVKDRRVPDSTPEPLREFITRLLAENPYDRPHIWNEENLCQTIRTVRQKCFGRTYTPTALQFVR